MAFKTKKILPFLLLLFYLFQPFSALAQNDQGLGVAQRVEVTGKDIVAGSIISSRKSQYFLSQEAYDKNMFGVVTNKPAIEISMPEQEEGTYAVLSAGTVPVRVSGEAGAIKKGDRVTSSSRPGIGMKAEKTGFILGIAQESFSSQTADQVKTIPVFLNIKFAFAEDSPASEVISKRMLSMVNLSAVAALEEPKEIFRYTLGGFIVLTSIGFAFFTFGKIIRDGVQGIARNPLAKNGIIVGMIFNVIINIVIVGVGLSAAYFVISLP
jgi:hypothetical protein